MVFVGYGQNIRRHNAISRDELVADVVENNGYVFDNVHNKLVFAHCTVTSNFLTVTDENHKRCMFSV